MFQKPFGAWKPIMERLGAPRDLCVHLATGSWSLSLQREMKAMGIAQWTWKTLARPYRELEIDGHGASVVDKFSSCPVSGHVYHDVLASRQDPPTADIHRP